MGRSRFTLLINEIFTSIDGEVNEWGQGTLSTFIRMQGCNLRCSYCDTTKALEVYPKGYSETTIRYIRDRVRNLGCDKVTITGGEPLFQQPEIFDLISLLHVAGYKISIETNGTFDIPMKYLNEKNICWIVDYKWGYSHKMKVDWNTLSRTDWIKFPIEETFLGEIFEEIKKMKREGVVARIAVSGVDLAPDILITRLINEKMFDVSLNVQIHKLIDVR